MDLAGAEVVAFGDEDNDAGLFALADRSVAVGNAISTLKEGATEVIGSTPGTLSASQLPLFRLQVLLHLCHYLVVVR